MNAETLAPLVGDLRQFASVRPVILDDGPERGQRALLFTTGGGLDFMVLVDRAMDIGTLSHRGVPLAWQSAVGFRSPFLLNAESDGGTGFNRGFSGFLTTCGLDHIRQPSGGQPLHGRFPGTPARLLAHGEDWQRGEPVLFCEGEAVQAQYGKECLRLFRRIEAPIGGSTLRILDRVVNAGPEPWPHQLLYHINLGFPGVADGTEVALDGQTVLGPVKLRDVNAKSTVICLRTDGVPESACRVSRGQAGSAEIRIAFGTDTLPYAQFWTDLRPGVGVLAIEPCSSNRRPDGTSEPGRMLQPEQALAYRLEISVGSPNTVPQRGSSAAV